MTTTGSKYTPGVGTNTIAPSYEFVSISSKLKSLIMKSSSLQNLATNEKILIPCPLVNKYEKGTIHTFDIPILFVITCNLLINSFTNIQSFTQ